MITLKNVSKSFQKTPILDHISFSFAEGQLHIVLGTSGSGKSTLLRILSGILPPDSGEIWIGKEKLTAESQPKLAEQIGYVIQEGGLFPHFTTWRNVALKATLLKWPKEKMRSRVLELCALVDMPESLLQRFPNELSGGQRQRVSLMRALMLDPPILLLDEPFGALDPLIRYSLQKDLKEIIDHLKKTVILVTHDIREAAFLGQTVTLLNEGKILQSGSFYELMHSPASPFVTEFINAQRPVEVAAPI